MNLSPSTVPLLLLRAQQDISPVCSTWQMMVSWLSWGTRVFANINGKYLNIGTSFFTEGFLSCNPGAAPLPSARLWAQCLQLQLLSSHHIPKNWVWGFYLLVLVQLLQIPPGCGFLLGQGNASQGSVRWSHFSCLRHRSHCGCVVLWWKTLLLEQAQSRPLGSHPCH